MHQNSSLWPRGSCAPTPLPGHDSAIRNSSSFHSRDDYPPQQPVAIFTQLDLTDLTLFPTLEAAAGDVGRSEGFAAAMQQIEALTTGSLIRVKVCLKPKGPFTCPLIYDGHRHFERTGYEPYFGMFDWLITVASTKQLEIEWLPDEAQSCKDCELNR